MAIKINFDITHNPEKPTMILAQKNGNKIGQLNAKSISLKDNLKDASEITFVVNKYVNGQKTQWWEYISNFKLIYCVEWDVWFEITVELDESTHTSKTVYCVRLGHAELSQIMIYDTEINTENDILREDYELPTVLYNETNTKASLLHRILEKAPHYKVIHVDSSIKNFQRMFTFNDISIYDAFQQISEEIHCLFVLHSNSDENDRIQRTISVYDLETNCNDCGFRGEYTGVCPECGSKNLNEGYGEDTTILISADKLANDIKLTSDTDSIKNCFKLVAGDDLMTATIRNCNPNGTDYIWYISEILKADMSKELLSKIELYNNQYNYYQNDYIANLNSDILSLYNSLVRKYQKYNSSLEEIELPICGYSSLMNVYYNTIDLLSFLQTSLMPSPSMSKTNAIKEAEKLTSNNLSPVAVTNIDIVSLATADSAVLSMAKTIIDSRYKIKIDSSELSTDCIWTGNFEITNYSDEEDFATSNTISININDNYSSFVQQKLQKALNKENTEDLSISELFKKSEEDFALELEKYSLDSLTSFYNSCQTCIDILIEQGIADINTWADQTPNLYDSIYLSYYIKLSLIESEMKIRQQEIDLIAGRYNSDGELISYGLQNYIEQIRNDIQNVLNFEKYLGNALWLEFCSFKREDKYINTNYISDGLNNQELFNKAFEFIQIAQKEIYKSSELQHSISTSLKNLLTIKKFLPLVESFEVGNWLRIMIDDEVYKLRLINYEIDFDNLDNISVEFSDVVKINSSLNSVQEVISKAASMATSYSVVQRQAQQGEKSNEVLNNWADNGLDATTTKIIGGADNQTQTWDSHGMLFRKYNSITDTYDDIQLKIINSTIAITSDNWKSTKTAIGNFYYRDPRTNELINAYGINGEVIIGKLMIGEGLGIYNKTGSLTFDENGFSVTNGINTVVINPNDDSVFNIKNNNANVLSFDEFGNLVIVGDITARSLTLLSGAEVSVGHIRGLSDVAISGKYKDLIDKPNFATVALSGEYDDLINKPQLSDVALSGRYVDLTGRPNLSLVALTGDYTNLINTPQLSNVALSGRYDDLDDKPQLSEVAFSGMYKDLIGLPEIPESVDISGKFDNPVNNNLAIDGQYLVKHENGSFWTNAETVIDKNGLYPVCGKAVYDFALSKKQDINNADKLLYVNSDGEIIYLGIEELRNILGL